MPFVKMDVPVEIWETWRLAAGEIGVNIPSWAKMQIHENLRRKAGTVAESPTAPVQEPAQGMGFIRDRIAEALAQSGGMVRDEGVPGLAAKLGLKSRSVFSSLGSMVGSGRVTHEDRVYKLVEG